MNIELSQRASVILLKVVTIFFTSSMVVTSKNVDVHSSFGTHSKNHGRDFIKERHK